MEDQVLKSIVIYRHEVRFRITVSCVVLIISPKMVRDNIFGFKSVGLVSSFFVLGSISYLLREEHIFTMVSGISQVWFLSVCRLKNMNLISTLLVGDPSIVHLHKNACIVLFY